MALDDSFAYRQPNSRTWIFLSGVKSLENDKDSLGVLGIDADPIVFDRE